MKEDSNDALNVLFSSNDDFCPYLGVSLYSFLEHNHDEFENINIFIFDDGIGDDNKDKLNQISKQFNQELSFIKVSDIQSRFGNEIHSMEKEGVSSLTTYSRLFTSSIIKDVDRLLYLDADSLILGSFKELWDIDLENYYIGAVEDLLSIDVIKENIGMDSNQGYINAGFLLINLKKWREDKIEEKFLDFQRKTQDKFIFHDQGIINGVCKDHILYLHPKYNLISIFHGIEYEKIIKLGGLTDYYDKETVEDAQENPIFVHFSGGDLNRPWFNRQQPYHELYYEYVNKTPFKDQINVKKLPISGVLFYRFYKFKILSVLLRLLPTGLAVKIANKRVERQCESMSK